MQPAKILTLSVTNKYTPEMETLRRSGFHDLTMSKTSEDEFDSHSYHIEARVDGLLAGMVRMTPEPPSLMQYWFRNRSPLPEGEGVVDANRAVVSEAFRGLGIYKAMMLEALRWALKRNFTHVVGAIEPNFPLREFLRHTGCLEVGGPIIAWHPPVSETLVQCIVWPLEQTGEKLVVLEQKLKLQLKAKGVDVVGENCFVK